MLYAYWDGTAISAPAEVVRGSTGEFARQPALSIDRQSRLHMAWSGGLTGGILYSRASAAEAKSADSWLTPKTLSTDGVASWPQIGIDAAGRIYIAYVVSLNEGRGVYLVTSIDGGDTWSIPILVFNAEAAGWQMVDHPALAVRPDGTLYLAWVQTALPGIRPPEGILYTRSVDRGVTWNEPVTMAGGGFDWPRLAVTSGQVHLLFMNAEGGAVWHRWSDQDQPGSSEEVWTVASRVPGWQGVTPPFAVAIDGDPGGPADSQGTLHLLGSNPALDLPAYSTWNGERWTSVEAFSFGAQVKLQLGAAAATRPQGGALAVAWLAMQEEDGTDSNELLFAARTIPTVVVQMLPEQTATPTPDLAPTPTPPLTPQPTPTPNLNKAELPETAPVPPLALSGGAAVLILAGVFITRWLLDRKQS
jgi:hypothetical protein